MSKQITPPSPEYYSDKIDSGRQIRNLLVYKYKTALTISAGGIAEAAFSLASTPVYHADTTLGIETRQNQILTETNNVFSSESQSLEAGLEPVQSRMVLGKTVDNLQFSQPVEPKYFPAFGGPAHNLSDDIDPELRIADFGVSEDWINLPFELTVKNSKPYILMLPDKRTVEGFIEEPLKVNNRAILKVDHILVNADQKFTLTKFFKLSAIENIREQLPVVSKGKTGSIINLSYTGTGPGEANVILNPIAGSYVGQNCERDVQVVTSSSAFASEELPRMEEALQEAENKPNVCCEKSDSLDIPFEFKGVPENLTNIEGQITALRTEEAGLAGAYTSEHPTYRAVLDKLSVLERAKKRIDRQVAELSNTQQEVIRLVRDVTTNQATYVRLLDKQQRLNIVRVSV